MKKPLLTLDTETDDGRPELYICLKAHHLIDLFTLTTRAGLLLRTADQGTRSRFAAIGLRTSVSLIVDGVEKYFCMELVEGR
jgi:hypothetical protein